MAALQREKVGRGFWIGLSPPYVGFSIYSINKGIPLAQIWQSNVEIYKKINVCFRNISLIFDPCDIIYAA